MSPIDLNNRGSIRRYLLGQLAPDEREAIEARYFADPGYFDLVDDEAESLADDASRDRLSPEEREQFDPIAGQPVWKRRLEFAALLNRSASQSQPATDSVLRQAFARIGAAWRSLGAPLQLAAAAGMVALTLGWPLLLVKTARTSTQVASDSAAAAQLALARSAQSDSAVLKAQLQVAQLEQQVSAATTTKLLLIPGMTRGGDDALYVPPGVTFVEIELATDEPLRYDALRISIRDGAGRLVRRESLTNSNAAAPVVRVPTTLLADPEYQVTLEGLRGPNVYEVVAQYTLRMRRR